MTLGEKLRDEGFAFYKILSSLEAKALGTANAISVGLGENTVVEIHQNLAEHARETTCFLLYKEFKEAIAYLFRSYPKKLVFREETADAVF